MSQDMQREVIEELGLVHKNVNLTKDTEGDDWDEDTGDGEAEKLISDFLSSRGDFINSDIENGKPLASILKDYFESGRCINIDYKKKTMELSFDIFCHQSKNAKEKQWFLRLLKSEKQVWQRTQNKLDQ